MAARLGNAERVCARRGIVEYIDARRCIQRRGQCDRRHGARHHIDCAQHDNARQRRFVDAKRVKVVFHTTVTSFALFAHTLPVFMGTDGVSSSSFSRLSDRDKHGSHLPPVGAVMHVGTGKFAPVCLL